MKGDLISRKALVKALIEERDKFPAETEERYSFGVKVQNRFNTAIRGGIRKALREIETAPAVEIVRCKDCIHRGLPNCPMCHDESYYDEDDGTEYYTVDRTDDYGFCHCGARMDKEE